MTNCRVAGCPKQIAYTKTQLCNAHYLKLRRYGSTDVSKRRVKPPGIDSTEWFWSFVDKTMDCWEWTGARHPHGYGWAPFKRDGERLAHRVSYLISKGPIPEGMHILHSCDNPPCVNPDHLRAGTRRENALDMHERGRHSTWKKRRTHCQEGHLLDESNTYIHPDGERRCRTCIREKAAARREGQKTDPQVGNFDLSL